MAEYFAQIDAGWREIEVVLPDGTKQINYERNIQRVQYDDAKIIAELPARLRLTVDKLTLKADGIDEVIVTVELVSAPLNDDSQVNFERAEPTAMLVDGAETILQLDETGRGTLELSAADVGDGVIVIEPQSHAGNSITIEVSA